MTLLPLLRPRARSSNPPEVAGLLTFATSLSQTPQPGKFCLRDAIAQKNAHCEDARLKETVARPQERLIAVARCREDPITDARLRERILCPSMVHRARPLPSAVASKRFPTFVFISRSRFTLLRRHRRNDAACCAASHYMYSNCRKSKACTACACEEIRPSATKSE